MNSDDLNVLIPRLIAFGSQAAGENLVMGNKNNVCDFKGVIRYYARRYFPEETTCNQLIEAEQIAKKTLDRFQLSLASLAVELIVSVTGVFSSKSDVNVAFELVIIEDHFKKPRV